MVKLCHEKMLILRCMLLPPKKNEPPPENLEYPDKKLNSLGIIFYPLKKP